MQKRAGGAVCHADKTGPAAAPQVGAHEDPAGPAAQGEVQVLADKLRLSQSMVQELEASNAELDKALHVALAMLQAGKV